MSFQCHVSNLVLTLNEEISWWNYILNFLHKWEKWPTSCEKGPSDIFKKCWSWPATASVTRLLVRINTFWHLLLQACSLWRPCAKNYIKNIWYFLRYRWFSRTPILNFQNVRRPLFAWRRSYQDPDTGRLCEYPDKRYPFDIPDIYWKEKETQGNLFWNNILTA